MEEKFLEVTWAGDMKVRRDLEQYTSPRGKGILREAVPHQDSLLLLRSIPSVILWGQTWVQIPTLQFSRCVTFSTLLNLFERHILLYKIEMMVSPSLSGYEAQRDHFCKTLNTLVCT